MLAAFYCIMYVNCTIIFYVYSKSLSVNDKRRYIGGGKGKKDVNAKPTTNFYKHDKIRNRPALNRNLKLATSSTKMVHHTIY